MQDKNDLEWLRVFHDDNICPNKLIASAADIIFTNPCNLRQNLLCDFL